MPDNNISQLVGERIAVNSRTVQVVKQLGEGGFSFVYLVKEEPSASSSTTDVQSPSASAEMVLKISSIHSRQQRDIAEKEAKLLARLSHPSIVRMYDTAYRSSPVSAAPPPRGTMHDGGNPASRPQHLILMEYCEGGTALSVCNELKKAGQRFDLPSLIIAFGQICNAVSYLHAQVSYGEAWRFCRGCKVNPLYCTLRVDISQLTPFVLSQSLFIHRNLP